MVPMNESKAKMVRYDSKLPDDSGEVSKLNGEVGSSIPGPKIVSLLDGN
jgi:hypothetical protein